MEDIRKRLSEERDRLIDELRRLGLSPETDEATFRGAPDIPLDPGDRAQASEGQEFRFTVRERVAERINKLDEALTRVADGTYGVCQRCGEAIEPARLAAVPEAGTCVTCQQEIERSRREERPSL